MITQREQLILDVLDEAHRPVPAAELARVLSVSTRTIRSDIAALNRQAKARVVSSGPQGYSLERKELDGLRLPTASISDEHRVLSYLLLHSDMDIYDLGRDCFLGENALKRVLTSVADGLPDSLELSVSGSRVQLLGPESELSRLHRELVALTTSLPRMGEGLALLLPDILISDVQRAVLSACRKTGVEIEDLALGNLGVAIAVALQRRSVVPEVEPNAFGQAIVDELGSLAAGCEEKIMQLAASVGHEAPDADDQPLRKLVKQAVKETLACYGIDAKRKRLVSELTSHISRLLARQSAGLGASNGFAAAMREKSPYLFDIAVHLSRALSASLGIALTEDEIALICVYLGLYSKPSEGDERLRAALVCPRYQSIRDVLAERLISAFGSELVLVQVASRMDDVGQAEENPGVDIICTTSTAPSPLPTVRISPALSDVDVAAIREACAEARKRREEQRVSAALAKFLSPDLFFSQSDVSDRAGALTFLAGKLQESGVVGADFLPSVVEREKYAS
ncbi:MAG: HTH domain-containing protein, partial [Propionibacteriaceae bacterium]|nr:HTH domain-containing protein [Propionibacteriaceae bacterium]